MREKFGNFKSMSKTEAVALTFILLIAIGLLDRVTGWEISFAFFYLIPIGLASWRLGKAAGFLTASAAALTCMLVGLSDSGASSRGAGVVLWNAVMRLGIFLFCAYTIATLRVIINHLKEERSRSLQLAAQVLNAQEDERQRIARELHDEASQALATLTLRIEEIKRRRSPFASEEDEREMLELKELTEHVLAELRNLAFTLRPTLLDDMGLRHALRSLFRTQLRKRGIDVTLNFEGEEVRLPQWVELTLFRVAQEAASNILRHSKAVRVAADLQWKPDFVAMDIRDDGVGFNPLRYSQSARLGIFGMRERVALLAGSFVLRSAPGRGTHISVRIPIQKRIEQKQPAESSRPETARR